MEYGSQGFAPGRHLLAFMRPALRRQRVIPVTQVAAISDGRSVRVAGVVAVMQRPPTAKGHVFLTLEDETGLVNIIIRPQVYQQHRQTLRGSSLLVIDGQAQRRDGALHVLAQQVTALETTGAERASSTFVR